MKDSSGLEIRSLTESVTNFTANTHIALFNKIANKLNWITLKRHTTFM